MPTPLALLAQTGLLLCIGLIGLVPPERGTMLLVPLTSNGAAALGDVAERSGALVVGMGAVRGSRIVAGERRRLLAPMLSRGILVLNGLPAFCGSLEPLGK